MKNYYPGESFGELSLLYNAPRAATIIAKNDCILWALDRETFNNIVRDAAMYKLKIGGKGSFMKSFLEALIFCPLLTTTNLLKYVMP